MPGWDLDPLIIIGCLGTGAIAGLLGGLLGIGGGVVIVPALLLLFDAQGMEPGLAAPMAVATSLATIIFTSLAAARAQIRRGAVRWDLVRVWTPFLLVGSGISGWLAGLFPTGWLAIFIGGFLLVVSIIMLAQWRPAPHRDLPGPLGSGALALAAGTVSGLAGIGGGNVIVPTLSYYNVQMQRATATSSTLGVPISLFGTLGFVLAGLDVGDRPAASLGYVYLPAALAVVTLSVIFAPIGVAIAHRVPALMLRRCFGVLLVIVASRILWSGLAAL